MNKPRVVKTQVKPLGDPVWCVVVPAFGFSFAAVQCIPCKSWKQAMSLATKSTGGSGAFIERTHTPEHGPDYCGDPARYWPGVYR